MTSQRAPPATNPPAQPAAVPRPPPTETREEPPTPESPSSCVTRRNAETSEASGPGAALTALPGYHIELPYTTGGGESLCEVLDALEQFNTNCDSLFGNIQGRLTAERQKYESLTSRITTCGERVRDLKDRREAITVISTPKFPTRDQGETNQQLIQHPDEEKEVVSLYKRQPTRPTRPFAAVRNRARATAGGSKKPTPPRNIAKPVRLDGHADDTRPMRPVDPVDQFEFSLLVPGEVRSSAHPRRAAGEERGLGRLPTHLPYVSGLLLFNTRDNPYKEYTDVNLFSQNRAERPEPKETKKIGDHGNIHDPHFLTRKYGEGGDFVMIDENDAPNVYDELSGVDLPLDQIALTDHWCPDFGGHEEHPTDFSPDRDAINPSAVNRRKKEGRRGSGDSAFSTIPSVSEMATRNSAKPTKPSFKGTPPMKQLPMKGPPPALQDKQTPPQLQSGGQKTQNVVCAGISKILEQRDAHAATVNTPAATTVVAAAKPEPARETTPKKLPANVTVLPPTLASNIPQPPPLDKLLAGKAAPPPVQHKVPIPPPPQLLGKSTGKIPAPPPLSTLLANKVPPKPQVTTTQGVPKPPAPTTQQAALVDQLNALKKTDVLIKTNRGGAAESKVKTAAMNNFTSRLRLLREGVQGKDEFSDDDDGDVPPPAAVATKKKEAAAVARPTSLAAAPADAPKNKVPPPPLPVVAAPRPGAKLGSRRQFKEENSDSDWDC